MEDGDQAVDGEGAALALTRYLSDEIPPMLFAPTAGQLVGAPRLAAGAIQSWLYAQFRGRTPLAVVDYLFHAAKKIHLLAELELMPAGEVRSLLAGVLPCLLELCPAGDRERLTRSLRSLGDTQTVVAATAVEIIHRPADAQATADRDAVAAPRSSANGPGGPPPTEARTASDQAAQVVQGLGRLNLLLDRLQALPGPAGASGVQAAAPSPALVAEIVGEVAAGARTDRELTAQLALLEQLGLPVPTDNVLRILSRSLADWALPSAAAEASEPGPVRAMRRVVGLARDRGEAMKRFSELVRVAVEEFNTGSLGRAVTMLDLADRMVAAGEVDRSIAVGVVDQAYPLLDLVQLRRLAEQEDTHTLLARVLAFFPQLSVEELLVELETERKRERRRFVISLLTVHGARARDAAIVILRDAMSGVRSASWFVERNLIHLLRRIPRSGDAPLDHEIDVLIHGSELAGPLPLVREALAALGQVRHERAEKTLLARVAELEDALVGSRQLPHGADELRGLLDSTVKSIARTHSLEAWRAVVAHGLKHHPQLGDTFGRLAALGACSLADDPATVQKLVTALRAELPVRLFKLAVVTGRKARGIECLVEALASTDSPPVRQLLTEIVEHYPGQGFAGTAAAVLGKLGAAVPAAADSGSAPPSLSGDLEVFGLPGLLQNLAQSRLSGTLLLLASDGSSVASLGLSGGMLLTARAGALAGDSALYQLLERPSPGRFTFAQEEHPAPTAKGDSPREMVPVLLEGMRRYDELVRATALVPDDGRYRATDHRPEKPPDETDMDFVRLVWDGAARGVTPAACEATAGVDSFRVRRLYERWVTDGALVPRGAAE